jgi:hypothetical protein
MIIELQIDAAVLMAAFRENMRQRLACQFTEFTLLRTQWRITSYEIGTTKLQRSQAMDGTACVHVGAPNVVTPIQVRTIQLVQQLTVNTCREDLLVDPNGALGPNVALHMDLIFAIETDSCGSMRQLCFRFLGTGIVSTQGEALLTAVASFAGSGIPVTIVRDDFSRRVPNTHSVAAPSQVRSANHLVTIKPAATEAEMMAMSIRQDRGATLRQTRLLPGAEIALPGECLQLATKMDNARPWCSQLHPE